MFPSFIISLNTLCICDISDEGAFKEVEEEGEIKVTEVSVTGLLTLGSVVVSGRKAEREVEVEVSF